MPGGARVVLEVDGKQNYATGDIASPKLYGEVVADDRALRLSRYDMFRFGGWELARSDAVELL